MIFFKIINQFLLGIFLTNNSKHSLTKKYMKMIKNQQKREHILDTRNGDNNIIFFKTMCIEALPTLYE